MMMATSTSTTTMKAAANATVKISVQNVKK